MSAFVEFAGVDVHAGATRHILRNLSLAVAEGETLALIGRSGSGKTTALRLINALRMPAAGRVLVAGRETTAWNPIELRRRTGYVIQEGGLFPHLTVADNVGMVPSLEGWPAPRIAQRTRELLGLVGLDADEFSSRRPHQLSGGQRQRVGVARALAADAPLLLLDEPFGALDPVTRRELQDEFRALTLRLGKTAVFVTHDLAEAARVADRIALLRQGQLVVCGTLDEFASSDHAEARAFVEASGAAGSAPRAAFEAGGPPASSPNTSTARAADGAR